TPTPPTHTLSHTTLFRSEVLSEQMLADALARQAAAPAPGPPAYRTCPGCQQPLACPDTNERLVQTRAGEAAWAEPEGYCDRCRRSEEHTSELQSQSNLVS